MSLLLPTEERDYGLYGLGGLLAVEGKVEEALAYLKELLETNSPIVGFAITDPAWKNIRELFLNK